MPDDPRRDWGAPEYQSTPPRRDVRDEGGRGCPWDFAVIVSPILLLAGLLVAVTSCAAR